MEVIAKKQVIIIGAGPAGLSLGYHLQQAGVDYLILEQNDSAGSSWGQMPDHLSLISLWHSNCLLEEDLPLASRNKAHRASEFFSYLKDFAKRHALSISYRVKVKSIVKEKNSFYLETDIALYRSSFVVDCRGYFNFPFIPDFPVKGRAPAMLHFKDYKNTDSVKDYKKILIVGKRLSAGQLVRELAATKRHELFLSARSPLTYSSRPLTYNFFLRNLGVIESAIKSLRIKTKDEIEVPMEFMAKKIVEKEVKVKGNILKIEDRIVSFSDGSTQEIDAILFATGFHPPSEELQNDFESKKTPGLFYLGRSGQRSFTSRFLRGIREDAPVLCLEIVKRLSLSIKTE